jgi:hypothetical protein
MIYTSAPRRRGTARLTLTLGLTLLVLAAAAATARAQSFSTAVNYSVGPNPNSAAAGDFNGDGKPDLAVGNTLSANVSILLNKGDGTFNNAVNYNADQNPEGTAVGDFNKDGKLDVAVGNFLGGPSSTGNISILLGNGNGTFQTAVNYAAGSPSKLTAIDLNADGNPDLVTASWITDKATVLLGNGNGTFQSAVTYSVGTQPREVAVGDFDKDGKLDLTVANFNSSDVSFLKGNGNGTFQAAVQIAVPAGAPTGIAAGDLNGDGKLDLALAAPNAAVAIVLLGNGNGTFQSAVGYPTGAPANSPKIADFNGDAKQDVAVVNDNGTTGNVVVFRGNGDGTLQSGASYPAQRSAFSLTISDLNVDGKPDAVVTNNSLALANVLLNSPSPHGASISATATIAFTGVQVASFTDFDTTKTAASFTATINWGDGTAATAGTVASNGSGGFNVTGGHTYAKEGTYNVSVHIADSGGNFADAASTATVADAPITATGKSIQVIRRANFTDTVASIVDADPTSPLSEYAATITWGDGSSSAGTFISTGGGHFDVLGTHSYTATGTYTIGVSITTLGGSTASATGSANVINIIMSGRVTRYTGLPLAGVTVTLQGPDSGTVVTGDDGAYSFAVGAGGPYIITPTKTNYVFNPPSGFFSDPLLNQPFNFTSTQPTLQFSLANYTTHEGDGVAQIVVTRAGDSVDAATVEFATSGGTASSKSDYTTALRTLSFGVGETSKTVPVLITENGFVTGNRSVNLFLTSPSGAILGVQNSSSVLTIEDNDTSPASVNPNDVSQTFVRQHYHDFLAREPDAPGLAFWTNEIESCGTNTQCREVKRINVSAAFFLSIEFQNTGYLVERMYKTAYGDMTEGSTGLVVPVIRLDEFLKDTPLISEGLIVGVGDWQTLLDNNKTAYAQTFVQRSRFTNVYGTLTPQQFVDRLNTNAGGVLTDSEKTALVNELTGNNTVAGRASVLRKVAENAEFDRREKNRAFVLMEYYGYMRRNPNDPQDTNFSGWKFWLDKLNAFNGDFIKAEMVKAFISSDEYRHRFGQ